MIRIFKKDILILFGILTTSFLLKLLFCSTPFLGHFGSYQSTVGMIAIEYARHNFTNFFLPTSLLLVNGEPSLPMIYHPLSAFLGALPWKIFGGSLDVWGRLQAIISIFLATIFVYLSAIQLKKEKTFALLAAFLFSFAPMSLIYGRMFMNEALALLFLSASLFVLCVWKNSNKMILLFISGLLFSVLLILRLHYIVLFPAFLFFIFFGCQRRRFFSLFLFALTSGVLVSLWFLHTYFVTLEYPNLHTSIFVQVDARHFPDPLLRSFSFYKTLVKEGVFRLWGMIPFLLILISLFLKWVRGQVWIPIFFLTLGVIIFIVPTKFYDHPFYLLPALIPGVYLAADALQKVFENKRKFILCVIVVLILISNIALFWRPAFTEPSDKKDFIEAVKFIKGNTGFDDRLIAAHGSSSDLLYYTGRYGLSYALGVNRKKLPMYFSALKYSPLSEEQIKERNFAYRESVAWFEYLKDEGKTVYLVIVPKQDLEKEKKLKKHLNDEYKLISKSDDNFLVYSLK